MCVGSGWDGKKVTGGGHTNGMAVSFAQPSFLGLNPLRTALTAIFRNLPSTPSMPCYVMLCAMQCCAPCNGDSPQMESRLMEDHLLGKTVKFASTQKRFMQVWSGVGCRWCGW
jgi:hypothetical protein